MPDLSSLIAAAVGTIGFGPGGVVPNSIAAAWQSSIGIVPAGSLFSLLQSIGASGGSTATVAVWSVVAGFDKGALLSVASLVAGTVVAAGWQPTSPVGRALLAVLLSIGSKP